MGVLAMAVLEQVMQLKNQGMGDNQIINELQQKGISPNEINTALSQAEIKNAVTGDSIPPSPNQSYSQQPTTQEIQEYPPQEGQGYGGQENYAPQEEYYPQGEYNQGYAPQEGGFDSSTIMEIAEQVFSEKTKKIEDQLEELNEFKTLTKTKVDNIDGRLKKIETMIDKLQITILEKVGSYGQNLGEIKKEISMMQDSFGKMINNVADKNSKPINSKKKISK
ncbi:MAG: hypothetical protein ABFQ65_03195 [Nanoarchaeota archaeon]